MNRRTPRLSFRYFTDDGHYTDRDLRKWLRILDALTASSVVLPTSPRRLIPESFVKAVQERSIQPIVHISGEIGSISNSELATMLQTYNRWGLQEVVVYDVPNLKSSWRSADWSRSGLVERFVDVILPILMMQRSAGLIPTLPPLSPGGDYWDLAFLRGVLSSIQRRGHTDLLEETRQAIYVWTNGQPLDWGQGGPSQWPEARPYLTPDGCQDHRGFRLYEWYQSIIREVVGMELPMRVVNGGFSEGSDERDMFWEDRATETLGSILRLLLDETVPPYILSFGFPLVSDPDQNLSPAAAWFSQDGDPTPVISLAQTILGSGKSWKKEIGSKIYPVYLLLSEDLHEMDEQMGMQILRTAQEQQAVIGFSIEDAKRADKVFLPTGSGPGRKGLEVELRAHGCAVRKISAGSNDEHSIGQILAGRFKGIMNSSSGVSHG